MSFLSLRPIGWKSCLALVVTHALAACQPHHASPSGEPTGGAEDGGASPPADQANAADDDAQADAGRNALGQKPDVPAVAAEVAPAASPRLESLPAGIDLETKVTSYFAGAVGRHVYIQVDKPLYKPGERIWVKSWDLRVRGLATPNPPGPLPTATFQLVSPKGAVVLQKLVQEDHGMSTNDLEIPADAQGGEYTLKAVVSGALQGERPIIISTYEAPKLKMKLEFVRKAYGEGDPVSATFELRRNTGEALGDHAVSAAIRLDGQDLPPVKLTTAADGTALVRFDLPPKIEAGDGLLTVLVDDGGVTESVSKRIPILIHKLQFAGFPEGGKLIRALPNRLYFEAKTPLGKPADVEGEIVDDLGNAVAAFRSYKDGLGRVDLTPATGRTYQARITKPLGVTEKYALPLPADDGCVLRAFDDLDGKLSALRVSVRCTEARKVIVTAVLRESTLDTAALSVEAGEPAIVYLEPQDAALARAQGIARVTLFDEAENPLAERLVFRNRRARLGVKIRPDQARYSPRAPVTLAVTTTDPSGAPIAADLALSVVDDTVVSLADDKTGHLLSRLLLEPEIPGKVEEPNAYLDLTERKSALALDLLMGTRGWRTFEWQPVLHRAAQLAFGAGPAQMGGAPAPAGMPPLPAAAPPAAMPPLPAAAPLAPPPPPAPQLARARSAPRPLATAPAAPAKQAPAAPAQLAMNAPAASAAPAERQAEEKKPMGALHAHQRPVAIGPRRGEPAADEAAGKRDLGALGRAAGGAGALVPVDNANKDWAAPARAKAQVAAVVLAPVRVFPLPAYTGEAPSVRTDFRETIFWAPSVKTDAQGHATVTFPASDAVTSFRVFSEGVGQGLAGRDESVIASSLPFSMSVKLPSEVSAGDVIDLPLTLANEETRELDVTLESTFGALLHLEGAGDRGGVLAASSRKSAFFPLTVTGQEGETNVRFAARAGGLSDEFVRQVKVTRLGFPQTLSRSGTAAGNVSESFDLGDAIAGSGDVTITLYPSPVATMISGLDGMLRQPSGCFEQTSSTNYPNVMVMGYLRSHDVADPALTDRSAKLLDTGYRRLTGYESKNRGYEWFGGDPGHEALTAYGLVQFLDMKRVYGNVDEDMLRRTVTWLKGRRDGKGGYKRDPKALDSFGRASPEVTDAYITLALVRAGEVDLGPELARTAALAESRDEYVLALAANTLLRVPAQRQQGVVAAGRLAGMQEPDGSWKKAEQSITRSGGQNLWVETTALAMLALLEAPGRGHDAELRKAAAWLQANRGGYGQWGATQATVLALEAITAYDEANRRTPTSGTVAIRVNGEPAGEVRYDAGRREPIVFSDLGSRLRAGKNSIEIHSSAAGLPYSMAVEYRSLKPATSPETPVDLTTVLEKTSVKMGDTVRIDATVTNKTTAGLPMTLARVGLPGGLQFQTWQLKELREKGLIAFYETRAREVILYFRDMKPSEVKQIPIDLIAAVPGHYTGPASSAYLYYNDTHKAWTDALVATIGH